MAFRRWRSEVCGSCGTHPDVWADDPTAYLASLSRCPGCAQMDAARREIPEGHAADGVHVDLISRGEHEAREQLREAAAEQARARAEQREREQQARLRRRKLRGL